MTDIAQADAPAQPRPARAKGPLIYRQSWVTRLTHWVWAISFFFLLFSGLQIFNAHPSLDIGQESGFEYDNAILRMYQQQNDDGEVRGMTRIFGHDFDTTGAFGLSGDADQPQDRGFPAAVTIPSTQDLATGRVVHFFFAWVLVGTLTLWLAGALVSRHLWRDIVLKGRDIRGIPGDLIQHAKLKFVHGREYSPLQKLSYFAVLCVLFPLIVLTGLSMSPNMNATLPWLLELFGGRQTTRTIHFCAMALLVGFFLVHVIMVFAAGPINEMRSMITGWYRASPGTQRQEGDKP